jgi:predicted ABC-type ATPase
MSQKDDSSESTAFSDGEALALDSIVEASIGSRFRSAVRESTKELLDKDIPIYGMLHGFVVKVTRIRSGTER